MNPKIANLIAAELGILIGLMSWLAYSRLPSAGPSSQARVPESLAAPVTAVASALVSSNQRPSNVSSNSDYSGEREQARLMAERSASLQSYYRMIATESNTSSEAESGSVAVETPSYSTADQSAVVPAEDYVPLPTFLYYAEPIAIQNVVFANDRSFRNRGRSMSRPGAIGTIPRRCPDRRNPNPNDARIVAHPNPGPPPGQPAQGVRPRELSGPREKPGFNKKGWAPPRQP